MKFDNKIAITSWAEEERPREKLATWGKNAVSLTELLAIIIGSGNKEVNAVEIGRKILHKYPASKLPYLTVSDLCQFKGIGQAKAISIIAALELGKRCNKQEKSKPEKITTSSDVYHLLKDKFEQLAHEEFWIVFLNASCKVITIEMLSKGGMTGTIVDPIIVMKKTIDHMAKGIVLAHNHPSGNLTVSTADKSLTKKIKEICQLLHINLLDHIVFTDQGFTSFADEGLL